MRHVWIEKKVTGPAKIRLLKYYDEADKLLSTPVWVKTIEDDKQLAEELFEHMNTKDNLIARCNRDWENLLKDLGTEKKAAEEKDTIIWLKELKTLLK